MTWHVIRVRSKDAQKQLARTSLRTKGYNNLHFSYWTVIDAELYTCQLFLRYKREILSWERWDFWRRHDHFRRFPKKSEVFRSGPKSSKDVRSFPKSEDAYKRAPSAFHFKNQRSQEGIAIYSFYTWFSFLTWVWVNIFLKIVSSKTATIHIFQSGVRNWPAGVSRREIEVFNPQAWDSRLRRESWQV